MSALDRLGESAVRVAMVFGYIADVLDVARGAKRRDMLSQGWAWLGLDTVCPLPVWMGEPSCGADVVG